MLLSRYEIIWQTAVHRSFGSGNSLLQAANSLYAAVTFRAHEKAANRRWTAEIVYKPLSAGSWLPVSAYERQP